MSRESAAFEHGESSYLHAPSPKRLHFDHSNGEAPEVMQVSQVVETVPTEDPNEVDTVTITVPSSQFEIEINSQVEEEEGEEVPQIQRSDLTGPAFGIVEGPQVRGSACDLVAAPQSLVGEERGVSVCDVW
jgi:hypothetical protein